MYRRHKSSEKNLGSKTPNCYQSTAQASTINYTSDSNSGGAISYLIMVAHAGVLPVFFVNLLFLISSAIANKAFSKTEKKFVQYAAKVF